MAKNKENKPSLEYRIFSKLISPDEDPVKATQRDKLMLSALGSVAGAAATALVPFILKTKFDPRPVIGAALSGGVAGYTAPTLANLILQEKRKEIKQGVAAKKFKESGEMQDQLLNAAEAFPRFNKKAGVASGVKHVVGTGLKYTGKTTVGAGKSFLRGVAQNPFAKKIPVGERVWGLASKGLLFTGGAYGVQKAKSRKQLSSHNYTTMLRNNILAGNVKPEEMTQADLIAVRNLGMR